jgi:hypothetical protein
MTNYPIFHKMQVSTSPKKNPAKIFDRVNITLSKKKIWVQTSQGHIERKEGEVVTTGTQESKITSFRVKFPHFGT